MGVFKAGPVGCRKQGRSKVDRSGTFEKSKEIIDSEGVETIDHQIGVFQLLARLGLGAPYLKIKDELAEVAPEDWTSQQIKRFVRPTHRCMLEVY